MPPSSGLSREVAVVVAHLVLFSQLGVLTRIGLDALFSNGCGSNGSKKFGTCLTSLGLGSDPYGAYFPDLPSNALGSFVMGLAAASSTLSLGAPKPLAALPASHPWQRSPELHIGVRTGFCGCLTTFSSWSSALLFQAVGGGGRPGGNWPQWLWGWVVGLFIALGSYAAGEHAARLLDDRLRPREERSRARRDAAAARMAVEAAPSIGVPWSGIVVSDGDDGDGEGGEGLLSSSSSSSTAAARRRGGGAGSKRWGIGGPGGGDEEAPASARPLHDAAARAAAKVLASTGEVALPLSAVARHHASRAAGSLARRSAVLGQLAELRRAAEVEAAAERKRRRRKERQPGGADGEGGGGAAAAAAAEEEDEAEAGGQGDGGEGLCEGGPSATPAEDAAAAAAEQQPAPNGGGDRRGRWRQRTQGKQTGTTTPATTTTEEEEAKKEARAAAAASLSTRSSSWRLSPPRALSPDAATTREICMPLTELAEKVREEEAATTTRPALPSSSTSSSSSSLPPHPAPPRPPLAARATSLLRRGYRSAARAAEGGRDAEVNLASYSFATRTNALAAILSLALWITFLLLFILDESKGTTASRRGEWLAVVLAPLGCLLRWRLATLNYSLSGKWKFLPAGTLAANLGGCLLTFTVAAVLERKPARSVWAAAVAKALQVGVAGSLSTVSTLSAEVTAQLRRAPADARGYAYLGLTWLCAQLVGVVVYGSAVWSEP